MLWISGLIKLLLPLAFGGAVLQVIGHQIVRRVQATELVTTLPTLKAVAGVLDAPRHMVLWQQLERVVSPAIIVGGTAIWVLCVIFLLARLGRDIRQSHRHNVFSTVEMEQPARKRLEHVLTHLGIACSEIQLCSRATMPGVTGILRPRILIPQRLIDALTPHELETILAHERAHQRCFDPFWALLQRLCSAFLFFYPLLPFLMRRLNECTEFACDEEIAASGLSLRTYARALNRTLRLGLEPLRFSSTMVCGQKSLLCRRLERLASPGRFRMSAKYHLFIVFAALLVTAGSFLPFPLHAGEGEVTGKASVESSEELPGIDEYVEYDTPPEVREFVPPQYPAKAKKEGITGTVITKLLIDSAGVVRDMKIVEGPEVFHKSVEEAAPKARFTPAMRDKKAVAVWVAVPIKFALDNK
jgi:TonB family protein